MITRPAIRYLMEQGLIKITPDPVKIGPNSIDLRLGDTLQMYHPTEGRVTVMDPVSKDLIGAIDPKSPPPLIDVPKVHKFWNREEGVNREEDVNGWLLVPGQFYLGCTLEETYCRGVVPHLDGRSTCGRLSIEAHKTAGVGDNGFRGHWTLEIEATEPVIIRPGDRLFQVYFTPAWGVGVARAIQYATRGAMPAHLQQMMPLIEVDDLYGKDGGDDHYQDSKGVRGASPLD